MTSFTHQQLETIFWIATITELGNLFGHIRSDSAFLFSNKLVLMAMFIEKLRLIRKNEKDEAQASP